MREGLARKGRSGAWVVGWWQETEGVGGVSVPLPP